MSEKKVGKRLLTWVLVLVMTLSLLPLNVLADEAEEPSNVKYGMIGTNGTWAETENSTGTNNSTGITGVKSVSKTAKPTTDKYGKIISNQYDVTLKVELEQTTSTTLPGAAATVLVMDHSASMNGCASCNSWQSSFLSDKNYYHAEGCKYDKRGQNVKVEYSQSRMAAATEAVKSFIKTYSGRFDENDNETKTENLNLGRWVCLVWFNKTGGVVNGGWLDVSNKDAYNAAIVTNGWKAQEGTNLDYGLKLANNQLQQDAVKNIGKSLKNVVVLTDGQPTYYLRNLERYERFPDIEIGGTQYKVEHNGKSCDKDTFQNTKNSATNLKQNASVYTVCFGASGEKIKDYDRLNHPEIAVGDYLKNKIATKKAGDKTYAYDAGDTNGLMSAFAAITKDIVSGLNSGTVTDSLPTGVTADNRFVGEWKLNADEAVKDTKTEGGVKKTIYTWEKTYTVTIDPEIAVADKDGYVPLNGKTTLTVEGGSVDFPIPAGKVTPKTLTLTATDYTGKYDGKAHGGTVTSPNGATLTYQTKDTEDGTYADYNGVPQLKDVGKLWVKVTAEKKGYKTESAEYTIEVTKRDVTLTSASDEKVYDGDPLTKHEVTVTGDGFVDGEGATYDFTGTATNVSDTQASNNTFTYTPNGNTKADNYNITTVKGTLTITPVAIELTANSDSKKYNGTALTADGYTISNGSFVGEEGLASVDVEGSQTEVGSSSNTITGHTLKDNTLAENYTITYKPGTLEVTTNDTALTISGTNNSYTYDGNDHGSAAKTNISGAEIQYSIDDGITWSSDVPTIKNVGKITVKAKATLAGYKDVTCSYTLEVTPRPVTVTARNVNLEVGDPLPEKYTARVSGMVDGEKPESLIEYSVTAASGASTATAGTYDITPSGEELQGNYKVTYQKGTLNVSDKTDTVTVTFAIVGGTWDDNTIPTSVEVTLTNGKGSLANVTIPTGKPDGEHEGPGTWSNNAEISGDPSPDTVITQNTTFTLTFDAKETEPPTPGTIQLGDFIFKNFESRYGASTEETFYAYATVTPDSSVEIQLSDESAELGQPIEPEQPTEPAQPAEPEQPAEPAQPAEPEQPAEPKQPAEPEQPTEQPTEQPDSPTEFRATSIQNNKLYEGSVNLKTGESKQFTFEGISLPAGTYRVEVFERDDGKDNIVYDDTTYSFILTVNEDGTYRANDFVFCAEGNGKLVPMENATKVEFTNEYTYRRPHHPRPKPTVEIEDDDALGLNTTDHFAYIVGYGNGEVRPQNNITRAEVATIFFRLLTDDVRDENLTKTNRYSDVTRADWYNTAVSTLSSMGIITGYPDGTFRPNAAITRAEFAAIAARFDNDGDKTAAKFSDIASHWAKDEISIAYNNGWITGYPNSTFGPQRDITRAETMTLVNRVLNRQPETEDDLLPNMTVWTDNANPKAWYYLAVQEATNSHYYEFKTNSQYEKWTELRETRDWTQLEK